MDAKKRLYLEAYGGNATKEPLQYIYSQDMRVPFEREDTMQTYEYILIHRDPVNGKATLLTPVPKLILAKSQNQANIAAGRAIPEEYAERLEEVEISIRPFGTSGEAKTLR